MLVLSLDSVRRLNMLLPMLLNRFWGQGTEMSTITLYDTFVRIPPWVTDLSAFRRWLHSEEFPEAGRIAFLAGEVWVDMSKEQLFWHNQVKQEFNRVLGTLIKQSRVGRYFPDGAFVSNAAADLSGQPDGTFVSHASFRAERVRLIEGAEHGFIELDGSPDIVLEVVSDSSVEKDTVLLRDLYWQAGVCEYWLVDVRENRLEFDILKRTSKGFSSTRYQQGWVKSTVLNHAFCLSCETDELDNPEYTLSVRTTE